MLLLSSFQTAKNNWSDVEKLGEQYYLMFDFMINHISAHSDYYLDLIYKRKDKAPWEDLEFADGSHEKTLYTGKSQRLAVWLKQCPMKQFMTLDTHDGLGVVDAKDILTDEEINYTTQELYKVGANVKRKYSSAEYNNLDIYQINTTYYSALGNDDRKYFLARLLQIFAPGIPQIYYVGLLVGENELDLLEFRNSEAAFDLAGLLEVATPSEHEIVLTRVNQAKDRQATARVNLADLTYQITVNGQAVDL